jgi:phosphatidylglycerol:prolipoprotein diacylglycerol transferase
MRPQLFRIPLPGGHEIPIFSYGVMIMLGFIFAIAYASWRAKREGIDPNYILDIGLYAVVSGILGARLMYYWEFYRHKFPVPVPEGQHEFTQIVNGKTIFLKNLSFAERPWYTVFYIHEGGIVFYGGFLLAALVVVLYLRRVNRTHAARGERPLPLLRVTDILACAVPIGLAFGRLGCFLNGCCWGHVSRSALAVEFPRGSPAWATHVERYGLPATAAHSLPVLPTQLFEWAGALAIAAILFFYYRFHKRDGQLFALLAILYGPLRYVLEGLREQDPNAERTPLRFLWDPIAGLPMTNSQIVSVAIFLVGIACFVVVSRLGPRYEPAAAVDSVPQPKMAA